MNDTPYKASLYRKHSLYACNQTTDQSGGTHQLVHQSQVSNCMLGNCDLIALDQSQPTVNGRRGVGVSPLVCVVFTDCGLTIVSILGSVPCMSRWLSNFKVYCSMLLRPPPPQQKQTQLINK